MGPQETRPLFKSQVHNYTIGPTNWDHNEVSVINSLRGDAITRIVYRRTDGRTDGQTDNGVSHKLDWSRPVELKTDKVREGPAGGICQYDLDLGLLNPKFTGVFFSSSSFCV